MQQLQSSYGGDRSDTLAQILGGDYDPQGQMAQMAQQMLATGMGSSTAIKTRAMQDDAALNRDILSRQYQLIAEKRARRNSLEDEMRKRRYGIEDYNRMRADKLEDLLVGRQQALEDRDYARANAVEDRNFARAATIQDVLLEDLKKELTENRVISLEDRKRSQEQDDLRSKVLGKRKGLQITLQQYRDTLNPNDPAQALERASFDRAIAQLDEVTQSLDPTASAALIDQIANVFGGNQQTQIALQSLFNTQRGKGTANRTQAQGATSQPTANPANPAPQGAPSANQSPPSDEDSQRDEDIIRFFGR